MSMLDQLLDKARDVVESSSWNLPRKTIVVPTDLAKRLVAGKHTLLIQAESVTDETVDVCIADHEYVYGTAKVNRPKPVTLNEFRRRESEHGIDSELRRKMWPRNRRLYAHDLLEIAELDEPQAWQRQQAYDPESVQYQFKRAPSDKELAALPDVAKDTIVSALSLAYGVDSAIGPVAEQIIKLTAPKGEVLALLQGVPHMVKALVKEYNAIATRLELDDVTWGFCSNIFTTVSDLVCALEDAECAVPKRTRVHALTSDVTKALKTFGCLEGALEENYALSDHAIAYPEHVMYELDDRWQPVEFTSTDFDITKTDAAGKLPVLKVADPKFNLERIDCLQSETGILTKHTEHHGRGGMRQFLVNEVSDRPEYARPRVWGVVTTDEPTGFKSLADTPEKTRDGIDAVTKQALSDESAVSYTRMNLVTVFDPPLELKRTVPGRQFGPVVSLATATEKREEPMYWTQDSIELPEKEQCYDATLQLHFHGQTAHADFRVVRPDDTLDSWTLGIQKADTVFENPVSDVQQAQRLAANFSLDGGNWCSDFVAPEQIVAQLHEKAPCAWLQLDVEKFECGTAGALATAPGFLVTVARPQVSYGLFIPEFREYYLERDANFRGILKFERITHGESVFWACALMDSLVPSIIKLDTVGAGYELPRGWSLLPAGLKEVTPLEFQYWHAEDADERKELHKALVESEFFNDDNIRIVDGEIRRVVTKYYLYQPDDTAQPAVTSEPVEEPTVRVKKTREIRGIVHARRGKGARGMYDYFYAVGPISDEEAPAWRDVVKIDDVSYIEAGRVTNVFHEASVGTILKISVDEISLDVPAGRAKRLRGIDATVVETTDSPPTTLPEIEAMLLPGEARKVAQDLGETVATRVFADEQIPRVLAKGYSEGYEIEGALDERYVLGIVLEPDTFDSQGDIYDEMTVRDAAHWFMENGMHRGFMHRTIIDEKITILESYVTLTDMEVAGQQVRKGTWLMAARINDTQLWEQIKSGDFTGWSIGGSSLYESI